MRAWIVVLVLLGGCLGSGGTADPDESPVAGAEDATPAEEPPTDDGDLAKPVCSGPTTRAFDWTIPDDYDRSGDSGEETFTSIDGHAYLNVTASTVSGTGVTVSVQNANGTTIWSRSDGSIGFSSGSNVRLVNDETDVGEGTYGFRWSTTGVADGLHVTIDIAAC